MARLLSAAEAARRLNVSDDIAGRVARKAYDRGDPGVEKSGRQYAATLTWWRKAISERTGPGRPREEQP